MSPGVSLLNDVVFILAQSDAMMVSLLDDGASLAQSDGIHFG